MGNAMNTILSSLPDSVHVIDVDVPFGLFVFVTAVIFISGKLSNCCTHLFGLALFRRLLAAGG